MGGGLRVSAAEGPCAAVWAAVRADTGLAVESDWTFTGELARGAVVRVPDDRPLPPIDLWAVFQTGRTGSAKARSFAELMRSTRVFGSPLP